MRRAIRAQRRALLLAMTVIAASLPPEARAQTGDVRDVPDPSIIKHGDSYYIVATGAGIPIRRSKDLIHWELVGQVFDGPLPSWAQQEVPGTRIPWAPDIAYYNGKYYLYYSLSTFGSQRSVIALATNETLDPSSPRYRWVDHGKVLESWPNRNDFNAIDPNMAFDENGEPWLAWGSFWGGIKMRKLDPRTGLLSKEDTTTYSLAARPRERAIEGAYIIRRGEYFYLFVSFDHCCRGSESDYNVRVGRSKKITGPYVDRDGVPMTEGGGTLVLASVGDVRGPGHNSILVEGDRYYIVHHYVNVREGPASPDAPLAIPRSLQIRPLYWTWDGWPVAGEPIAAPQARAAN
jgi:arabinan endo-1,5-alpha-L-arabinosidase